jgi:hypothetical protein
LQGADQLISILESTRPNFVRLPSHYTSKRGKT